MPKKLKRDTFWWIDSSHFSPTVPRTRSDQLYALDSRWSTSAPRWDKHQRKDPITKPCPQVMKDGKKCGLFHAFQGPLFDPKVPCRDG